MNGYSQFMDWDSDAGKTLKKGNFHKQKSCVDTGACKSPARYGTLEGRTETIF